MRTDGQARYVKAMNDHDLTVCIGPAGTGKSWLAVGMAVSWLRQGAVKKIILVRPAVVLRILSLAVEIAAEGREAHPVGTMFVVGDSRNVLRHAQQLLRDPVRLLLAALAKSEGLSVKQWLDLRLRSLAVMALPNAVRRKRTWANSSRAISTA